MRYAVLAMLAVCGLAGCNADGERPTSMAASAHPEARIYDAARVAQADVDAAFDRAALSGKNVLVALGANWCHDSRAFAGWLETPRFAAMLDQRFEVVFVDIGNPQGGKGRNLDIAQRFGIEEIIGTPTVLIIATDGSLLNPDTAATWRNAASRSEDAIFEELVSYPASAAS